MQLRFQKIKTIIRLNSKMSAQAQAGGSAPSGSGGIVPSTRGGVKYVSKQSADCTVSRQSGLRQGVGECSSSVFKRKCRVLSLLNTYMVEFIRE